MTSNPVSINLDVRTLTPATLVQPGRKGNRFHVMITATLAEMLEGGSASVPLDMGFAIDGSGSTRNVISGGDGETIMDIEKASLINLIENVLTERDRVTVAAFGAVNDLQTFPLTTCDAAGKIRLIQFISGLQPDSADTVYSSGLDGVMRNMPVADERRKRAIVFVSDGANNSYDKSSAELSCEKWGESGGKLYIAGIGVKPNEQSNLDAMAEKARGECRSVKTAQEVIGFFSDAQANIAAAAVTDGKLTVNIPDFVKAISNFELVYRGKDADGNLIVDYISAVINPEARTATVEFKDMSTDVSLVFYLGLEVDQPDDAAPARKSYGQLQLDGNVPARGLSGTLKKGYVVAVWSDEETIIQLKDQAKLSGTTFQDKDVETMISAAATCREFAAFGATGDPAKLANARRTVAMLPKDRAAALQAQIEAAERLRQSDPEAARQTARQATKAFSAKDRAAALNINQ